MAIVIDTRGRKRDPETLAARKELALHMLRHGKRNSDISAACREQFNGVGASGALLTRLRAQLEREAKRAERQARALADAMTPTRAPQSVSEALCTPLPRTSPVGSVGFALEVVRQGGRCILHPDGRIEVLAGEPTP